MVKWLRGWGIRDMMHEFEQRFPEPAKGGRGFKMCPECGSSSFSTTLIGHLSGHDPNTCLCCDCGCRWRGAWGDSDSPDPEKGRKQSLKKAAVSLWLAQDFLPDQCGTRTDSALDHLCVAVEHLLRWAEES